MMRIDVDGLPVDVVDPDGAVRLVSAWMGGSFRHVLALNAAKAERARRDDGLRDAIRAADLVLADGVGVVWQARRRGHTLVRLTGIDLMEALLAQAARHGWSVFLLGGRIGVAQRAAEVSRRRWPGLIVAGARHGEGTDDVAADVVRRSGAQLLVAGLGTPRQETMLHRLGGATGASVGLGVGGALDVLCGDLPRAPVPLRAAGLEWAWRLGTQPGRLWQGRTMDALRYVLRPPRRSD